MFSLGDSLQCLLLLCLQLPLQYLDMVNLSYVKANIPKMAHAALSPKSLSVLFMSVAVTTICHPRELSHPRFFLSANCLLSFLPWSLSMCTSFQPLTYTQALASMVAMWRYPSPFQFRCSVPLDESS